MDLACGEPSTKCIRAVKDKAIFKDHRVIKNLLGNEKLYLPNCDYFVKVQNDIQPFMRRVVTTWMLEVCEEQMCEEQILPLAVNFMDRFLCVCKIKRQHLQLLGATCLLIASKLRMNWEQLVLSKLQYNISAVTGYDYIDQVIERSSWSQSHHLLRRHAHTLVSICSTEPTLIQTPPSVVAAACLCSAVRGLKLPCQRTAMGEICHMLNISMKDIELLINLVDKVVEKVANPDGADVKTKEPPKKSAGYESPGYCQPETPTEVENIYF